MPQGINRQKKCRRAVQRDGEEKGCVGGGSAARTVQPAAVCEGVSGIVSKYFSER